MRNQRRHWILALLIWMAVLSFGEFARGAVENPSWVQVTASSSREITVQVTAPKPHIQKISTDGGTFDRVIFPDWGKTSRTGYPELPIMGFLVQVPDSGALKVEILNAFTETVEGLNIYPVPEMVLTVEEQRTERFVKDSSAYGATGFYPEKKVTVHRLGDLRGTPVARVEVYPFQWNAATSELRCCRNMELKISFEKSLNIDTLPNNSSNKNKSISLKTFDTIKRNVLINSSIGLTSAVKDTDKYVQGSAEDISIASPQSPQRIRIEVREDGIYRMTYAELVAAGLPAPINPLTFQIFNGGLELAIRVVASGSVFTSGDFIEFYGESLNTQFTDTNVYWLRWGVQEGRRLGTADDSKTDNATAVTLFYETLHFEENDYLWYQTPGAPDEDYFFWRKMTAPITIDFSAFLHSPVSSASNATVRVCFQGISTAAGQHHSRIRWNGIEIAVGGDGYWTGANTFTQTMTVSPSILFNGVNTCTVELVGDAASLDSAYLNWIEVDYWRGLEAVSNRLDFRVTGAGPRQVSVKGFNTPTIILYDITDALSPTHVSDFSVVSDGGGYKAVFTDLSSTERRYWIGGDNAVLKPANLVLWQTSDLHSTANGADWIVITKKAFLSSVTPLVALRQSQGYRSKAVAVEDIYNEFNNGIFDPAAIKEFLEYAYQNWTAPAPGYLLLAGDATLDYRNYLKTGRKNIIPPHVMYSKYLVPSDNWYVCMGGASDILPDMCVGRIPGSSAAMLAGVVSKIMGFSPAALNRSEQVLLVADNGESSFENVNNELIAYLPEGFGVQKVYLGKYGGDTATATRHIIQHMDQGALITEYLGHGSVTKWADETLFTNRRSAGNDYTNDVDLLSNGNTLSFLVAMTCLNGYFCQPYYYCLAEAFMAGENRGTIGIQAPSGSGYVWEHEILGKELFSTIFQSKNGIMGSAVTQAKIAAYGKGITSDAIQTLAFFGDPATVLLEPFSGTAYVSADKVCGGKTPCCGTINEAIAGSPVPDVIQVSQGVYNEEIVVDGGKEITIEGGWNSTFTEKGGPTSSIKNPVIKSGSGKFLNLRVVP